MLKKSTLITVFLLISLSGLHSQTDANKKQDFSEDFKVISSNNNYVEIEYTPKYKGSDFINSYHQSSKFGYPDIGCRYFSVITPSDKNNRIEVINSDNEKINNADIKSVPTPKKSSNSLELLYEYTYDEKIYNANEFYPKESAVFTQDGVLRNKYIGIIQINPIQYNPVQKTINRIKSIRFRVIFGNQPVLTNKPLSSAEKDFFRNASLNWQNAINWSTVEFNGKNKSIQNSVFGSGDFYKIEVKETGIYKIKKSFLQQAGINVNNIDPRTIKIYGNGGREVTYLNSASYPFDPVENRIYVEGENDGKFDDNDYILFYGLSPNQWVKEGLNLNHKINHYTNSNYYWITFGGTNGLRMQISPSPNFQGIPAIPYFKEKLFEEPEVNNLGSTGNIWVSQRIGYGDSFTFNKDLTGYIPGSDILIKTLLCNGTTNNNAQYLVKDDNSGFSSLVTVYPVFGLFTHINSTYFTATYQLNPGKTNTNLKFQLPQQYNYPSVSGYYDYLELFYNRSFNSVSNNYLNFSSPDSNGIFEFQISPFNGSDVKIFKVDSYDNTNIVLPISYSNNSVVFQENSLLGNGKEFFVVSGDNYKTPNGISQKIANQNLKAAVDGFDYIIISPTEFLPAANRLKQLRESYGEGTPNYLKTLVVDVNQIYNEFAAGIPDPVSLRNYLKYAYNNWNRRPVYVLFLGDGHFDYKNIYGLNIKNWVPPIERDDPTMSEISSYNSDDFICDINENYISPEYVRPDFATGRMCVNSLTEANNIIDKVISYESNSSYGLWKKKNMYVGDDGWTTDRPDGSEGDMHTRACETIAETYTKPDFEKEKIYIVSYPTVYTPQGRRKPDANVDILKGWNEGRLIINYTGHGSTDLWAHEHIFVRDESIPQLKNKGKYPFVTIASCDLARWDDPFLISAAEQLVFIPDAGAIGVIAATRPVFAQSNEIFNNFLWSNLMFAKDTLNLPIRSGKALSDTKNQLPSISDNDVKYVLIGDPALRVSIPQYFTRIDSINSTSGNDTAFVQALQKMRITGSILKPDSTFWSNYNGDISLKVLDVDKLISMIDYGQSFNWRVDGGIIFKGTAKVQNGKWQIEFIVPKDISYTNGNGKILAYFSNNVSEGSGFTNKFTLNGINTNAPVDTTGPSISLFMDSRNFRSGDIINQKSKIIADIFDYSGINLTGVIGHKLEAIINNNENSKIDLTNYYNATSGYQYGSLEYPIDGLTDGSYSLKLKAWDTYNNLSENTIFFTVKNSSALAVSQILNYPNPMRDFTSFTFQHNFDIKLSADIKIYTVAGRLIKTIKRTNIADKNVLIEWDGKDEDGDNIANGTYLYKLLIKSEDGTYSNVQTGKLAKLK